MGKDCRLYFEKGAQVALIQGYTPEDIAACNLKKRLAGVHSSRLSRGGKRRTRRYKKIYKNKNKNKKKTRRM